MTVARSVADVLDEHVAFEVECIDRMYCNVYVPQLQHAGGLLGFVQRHLGFPVASTAPLAKITDRFAREVHRFVDTHQVPWVNFVKGRRKDDVMRERLAGFTAEEGVVFIGRAQEKTSLFRTEKRRDQQGRSYRQGEAFGLTVDRLNFLRRALTVDRQLVLLPGREPYLAPPKTAASVRTVPLPRVVVDSLAGHLAEYPPLGDGFVFTTERGRPLRRTSFSAQAWQPAVATAGLLAGTHFHDLRHFYASLLIRHGESVKVVQARLGHASAAETLDTYSHLWPDSDDRTREAVDAVLGTAAVPLSLAGPV